MADEQPPVNGVYFLFDRQRLTYVGRSRNCAQRVIEHRRNGRPFDAHYIMAVPNNETGWVEMALIKALEPKQNRHGKERVKPGPVVVGPPTIKQGPVIYQPTIVKYDPNEIYWLPQIREELSGYRAVDFVSQMKSGQIPASYQESGGKKFWNCRADEVFKWKRAMQDKWGTAA